MRSEHKNLALVFVTLLTSSGTLLCCALPALLVTLGAGAALAGLVTAVPQLIWLSEHKVGLFIVAGVLLLLSGLALWFQRNAPCPADPVLGRYCDKLRRVSRWVYYFAVACYLTGGFFAFVAAKLFA